MTRVFIAGYYTPAIAAIQWLFAEGLQPSDITLATYTGDNRNSALLAFAETNRIKTIAAPVTSNIMAMTEVNEEMDRNRYDMLFSLYYRHRIPQRAINAVQGRAVNIHPALLPKYAGCWSSAWAMINGEHRAGFTWHYMTEKFDSGNIILQQPVIISPRATAFSLYHESMYRQMQVFDQVFYRVLSGYPGYEQTGERSYYDRSLPYGGEIDPTWPEVKIERFIRAMIFPPFKPAMYKGIEITSMTQYKGVRLGLSEEQVPDLRASNR